MLHNPFRYQLASTSPIHLGAVAGATGTAFVGGDRKLEELREKLCAEYSVADSVLVGSGTDALVLALRCAESLVGTTAPVALPAFNCFDVAAAAVRHGSPIHFYDLDPDTLGPDPTSLSAALAAGARTALIATLYGIPTDWKTIEPILAEAGAVCVEDAAQGHGAAWHGARLGGHGRLGVLSFGRGKGWTGGAGGAMLVRAPEDSEALGGGHSMIERKGDRLAPMVKAAAQWMLGRPSVYGLPRRLPGLGLGETTYHEAGAPTAMPATVASLVSSSKEAADIEAHERVRIAGEYAALLAESSRRASVRIPTGASGGFIRYPLLLPRGMSSFVDADRAATLGAAPSYPRPLSTLGVLAPLVADEGIPTKGYPVAELLSRGLVTLPTHSRTTAPERRELIELLDDAEG